MPNIPEARRDALPETYNFAVDVIDEWARDANLKAMIWANGMDPKGSRKDLTYEHFSSRSNRIAIWMTKELGIKKRDRVIIMLHRLVEWWEIILACIRIGVVPIPCTTLLTSKDIEYRLGVSGAKVFIGDSAAAAKVNKIKKIAALTTRILIDPQSQSGWHSFHHGVAKSTKPGDKFLGPKTKATDPCIIYFTSGTSGPPKMVQHNQISYPLGHQISGKYWYRMSPGKIIWSLSDPGWGKAIWGTFAAWSWGAAIFIQDDRGAFSAENLIRTLQDVEITTLCAPPTVYRQLILKENLEAIKKKKPRALDTCISAGEALNPQVFDIWKASTGMHIHEGYGQTETILLCGSLIGKKPRPGSMGCVPPQIPLSIIDEKGNEVPPDVEGNIAILLESPRLPWMFDGYIQPDGSLFLPELKNPATGKRWYITGDRAWRDKDGYLWYVGRADDVINTAGYRVGPFEIESCLKEHQGIVESAVVASPDAMRGDIVKAFIVLTEEYKKRKDLNELAKELKDFVAQSTAPYKKPREVEFVESLPKTISGKVRRVELRAMEKAKKASKGNARL